MAFEAVCPTRLDLLHQHYRRLCKLLPDVDEWGQVDLVNLLLRYARTMLPRPVVKNDSKEEEVDKDVKLLLESVELLLHSRNPAVREHDHFFCVLQAHCPLGNNSGDTSALLCRDAISPSEIRPSPPPAPEYIQRSPEGSSRIPPPDLAYFTGM